MRRLLVPVTAPVLPLADSAEVDGCRPTDVVASRAVQNLGAGR